MKTYICTVPQSNTVILVQKDCNELPLGKNISMPEPYYFLLLGSAILGLITSLIYFSFLVKRNLK